jgi:hypothetical protein
MTETTTFLTTQQAMLVLDQWYAYNEATKEAALVALLRHLMSQSLVLHDTP